MRDYGKISPRYWTGKTGREMRKLLADVEVPWQACVRPVASYLLSGPLATMTGLYRCPLALIASDTGCPIEGASKALRWLCDGGFCAYDEDDEIVLVFNMARDQVGKSLKPSDKRVVGVVNALEPYQDSPLYLKFLEIYGAAYHLVEAHSKPLPSPIEGAPMPESREQRAESRDTLPSGSVSDAHAHTPAHDMGGPDMPREPPADRYAGLYRLWCERGRRAVDEANANPERRSRLEWKPLPEHNVRHRIAEALNHTECLGLSMAQIAHGLDMLIAEGLGKPADDPDPFRWLRECWDGKRLATAVAIPSAEAARARASPAERRPKKQQESDRERAKRLAALASGGTR